MELAEVLMSNGSNTERGLQELWTRSVFNISVSTTDDTCATRALSWSQAMDRAFR